MSVHVTRYRRQRKIKICKALINKEIGFTQASWKYRIGVNSLYQWVKEFKLAGEAKAFRNTNIKVKLRSREGYRSVAALDSRDVATIRYGMMGVSDEQVGALYGKSRAYIYMVRRGEAGGPIAKPPTPPKVRSKAEANHWFLHKAIKTMEAWLEMLDKIEREDDPDIVENLKEADYETQPERPKRVYGRPFERRTPSDSGPAGSGDGATDSVRGDRAAQPEAGQGERGGAEVELRAAEQPALSPPNSGQDAGGAGPHGTGSGPDAYDRGTEGFIRRRRW